MSRSRLASIALASTSLLAAAGCATNKDKVFDLTEAPTMVEIYENHLERSGRPYTYNEGSSAAPAEERMRLRQREEEPAYQQAALSDYTRKVAYTASTTNETANLFPTLPNPIMVMYVHPHLAGPEGLPVPGYSTPLTLYQRTQFALPGEDMGLGLPAAPVMPSPAVRTMPAERDADRLMRASFTEGVR